MVADARQTLSTKEDIANLRTEFKEDIAKLETKIAESKAEMIKWLFIFLIGQLAAIIGIIKFFLAK